MAELSAAELSATTFGAFVGSSLSLIAINLKWHVVSLNVCTIAAV